MALAEAAAVSHERGIHLEDANRELAVLLDRTKELDRLKTELFANLSHELRIPLALILTPTEQLVRDEGEPVKRRQLEVVAHNARALLKHVNDLLDVSKLEAGAMELAYASVDAARAMRLAAGHFAPVAEERKITFEQQSPPALAAELDPSKLDRVALNLLGNAADAP